MPIFGWGAVCCNIRVTGKVTQMRGSPRSDKRVILAILRWHAKAGGFWTSGRKEPVWAYEFEYDFYALMRAVNGLEMRFDHVRERIGLGKEP